MRTGAQCVIDGMVDAGAEILFGLPGGAVLDLFAKLYHSPLKFILARHEQGATHMADGYARATGKVGCCIVTSGPGATNTVTGLATAHMDGIPIVCICGQVPSGMIGNDAFQEADTTGITRAVTKHNYLVRNADDLPRVMAEAFHIARTGKPGPVVIDIPKDVQQAETDALRPETIELRGYSPLAEGDTAQISALAEALNSAAKPLLYAGGGVVSGNAAGQLTALARKANIPVTTTLMGLGAFPETDPLALGMLGMHGSAPANLAVSHCDLLVSMGARFDDRVTGKLSEFATGARKAHVDIDPSAIDKSVTADFPVVGDAGEVLTKLIEEVDAADHADWLEEVGAWQREHPFRYDTHSPELLPQFVIEQVYEVTGGDAVIVTEVGQHQMWAAHYFKYTRPRTFLSSGGLGTMGYGLPAAIGAQAGLPGRTVIDIAGDGSIQMNFQELVVAVEHRLPVKVVILNNGYLGMVRQWQELFYEKEYSGSRLAQTGRGSMEKMPGAGEDRYLPDFVKLAEAHGAHGMRIRRKDEVIPALEEALAVDGPVVLECVVKEGENVYPMVPPGASLLDMVHSMA